MTDMGEVPCRMGTIAIRGVIDITGITDIMDIVPS